jgi:hypothetical protein
MKDCSFIVYLPIVHHVSNLGLYSSTDFTLELKIIIFEIKISFLLLVNESPKRGRIERL